MLDKKKYIGKEGTTYIFQEIQDDKIKGFNGYDLVELVDGEMGLSCCQWTHSVKLDNGKTYKTGESPAKCLKLPKDIKNIYEVNTVSCEKCGVQHDIDRTDATFVCVNECEIYCNECVKADDLLVELTDVNDVFKANKVIDVNLDNYKEIETLFCDSSGFGSENEPAMTKTQTLNAIQELLDNSNETLYAGISGVGQFQVYLSIYKKIN